MMILFGLFWLCIQLVSSQSAIKHLAGPPSEFKNHRVPDPSTVLTKQKSTTEYIWFDPKENSKEVYKIVFPVDVQDQFVFTFSSPYEKDLTLTLVGPNGEVELTPKPDHIPLGVGKSVPATVYIIEKSVVGEYELSITANMDYQIINKLSTSGYPNAVLTILNNDDLEIHSHYTSYLIKQGQEIGIISNIVDKTTRLSPETIVIDTALLDIITPDEADIEIPMTDDDDSLRKFNITPHSGVYGARILAPKPGEYLIQAKLHGTVTDPTTSTSRKFYRSTQHVIDVSDATLELTGFATLKKMDAPLTSVQIGVSGTAGFIRAYTEVWGQDEFGQLQSVCWIGGITEVEDGYVSLQLNTDWLKLAGTTGGLVLRNTYISDLYTTFPISIYEYDIKVDNSDNVVTLTPEKKITITQEMRKGVNPVKHIIEQRKNSTSPSDHLVLLPGYCSTDNPWTGSSKFTQAVFFDTKGSNWPNAQFAQNTINFINQQSLSSFSLVGHSQGGMVAAHILNYYHTGLDSATGGNLIQTVGTPWYGCSAAGGWANFGDIFGVGCGANNDLTSDGAANWISGITADTKAAVHYYTTTYKQGNLFGDSCSLPMNLVLQWPNDGTTELDRAQLQGGKNMGNTEKWCHTTGMNYPPQYTDETRNAKINEQAAR